MHMTTCLYLIKKSLNSQGNMEITLHNIKLQYIFRKTHWIPYSNNQVHHIKCQTSLLFWYRCNSAEKLYSAKTWFFAYQAGTIPIFLAKLASSTHSRHQVDIQANYILYMLHTWSLHYALEISS